MRESTREKVTDNVMFITPKQAMERYGMCRNSVMRLAEDAGASHKFGKRMRRIEVAKMDAYMFGRKTI